MKAEDVAKMIDHSYLKAFATEEELKKICDQAKQYSFISLNDLISDSVSLDCLVEDPKNPINEVISSMILDSLLAVSISLLDALLHLRGRLLGEGQRNDLMGLIAMGQQVGNLHGQHTGLAAARPCYNKHWSFRGPYRRRLLWIQLFENCRISHIVYYTTFCSIFVM